MIYKSFKDTELFETYEYNIEDKDINYCIVDINGRFPKKNFKIFTKNINNKMFNFLSFFI